jgi:four helix bundle protein
MENFKELKVYQLAFNQAIELFEISRSFPKEEQFSLVSQVRRSSRAVCSNLAEAYRKRKYKAHFISKVTDADAENSETSVWLDFIRECEYAVALESDAMLIRNREIGRLLGHMLNHPERYLDAQTS